MIVKPPFALGPVYMEWGTPVYWGWFLLFSRSGGHKTKETYPTRPGPLLHVNRPLITFLLLSFSHLCCPHILSDSKCCKKALSVEKNEILEF